MYSYKTHGTCCIQINLDIKNGNIQDVQFVGGCRGNQEGIKKLVIGEDALKISQKLEGINCRFGTSCPDQLSKAIIAYLNTK